MPCLLDPPPLVRAPRAILQPRLAKHLGRAGMLLLAGLTPAVASASVVLMMAAAPTPVRAAGSDRVVNGTFDLGLGTMRNLDNGLTLDGATIEPLPPALMPDANLIAAPNGSLTPSGEAVAFQWEELTLSRDDISLAGGSITLPSTSGAMTVLLSLAIWSIGAALSSRATSTRPGLRSSIRRCRAA